jgi:hypothetical protein
MRRGNRARKIPADDAAGPWSDVPRDRTWARFSAIGLTNRQGLSATLVRPEVKPVANARDPGSRSRSSRASFENRSLDTEGFRLAHWPPPFRKLPAKPKVEKRVQSADPKRATPRGWRITRSMFSEFEE